MSKVDVSRPCADCGQQFKMLTLEESVYDWIEEQRRRGCKDPDIREALIKAGNSRERMQRVFVDLALVRCERCRTQTGVLGAQVPAALANQPGFDLSRQQHQALFADLRQLFEKASEPLPEGFWQKFMSPGAYAAKRDAGAWLNIFLQQKLDALQKLKAAALSANELRNVHEEAKLKAFEARVKQSQAELQLQRIEAERLKLEEETAHRQALREERLNTLRLEANREQRRLLNEINPPPPPPPPAPVLPPAPEKPEDEVKRALKTHRQRVKVKASASQLLITDFVKEALKVFRANEEDAVKAVRIRTLLDIFQKDVDALPKKIRAFLEEAERVSDGD
jgi:hypothetical protein